MMTTHPVSSIQPMSYQFPENWADLNIALSHDWLTGMRGGERILELLGEGFPDAPIYSLIHNHDSISDKIASHSIMTSWLQRVPNIRSLYRYFLPLFPHAIESLKTQNADLLISTSHCVAKGLNMPEGTRHLCYCFTPMRYAWLFYDEYFGHSRIKKMVFKPVLHALRKWDYKASERVDHFVAISQHVQKRIKAFYNRDADVVYPPVDTERCTPASAEHEGYDLIVSALVPYKRIDLAVRAYNRLGYPLKIVGVGTELDRLRKLAEPTIQFLEWKSDLEIVALYQKCRFLIFPGEEDFGIVPVEAMACGRPVIAFGQGGTAETVIHETTGVHFQEQTEDSLFEAVEQAARRAWDSSIIRHQAERFSIQNFLDGLNRSIQKCMAGES